MKTRRRTLVPALLCTLVIAACPSAASAKPKHRPHTALASQGPRVGERRLFRAVGSLWCRQWVEYMPGRFGWSDILGNLTVTSSPDSMALQNCRRATNANEFAAEFTYYGVQR